MDKLLLAKIIGGGGVLLLVANLLLFFLGYIDMAVFWSVIFFGLFLIYFVLPRMRDSI